ncbi:M56 family metallopeptidase [Erythrobacter sp.]|jgi:beta-lactamase regulating signal transducer with metallopeptidase domain|uniref:M56 family metallopeptidase n=1 Tax=Erythrobacter sp. TaxID=1042 RepID=UPI002EB4ABFB|nr:M56 family metallopeptidase [Erythrobacter sp.]
MSGWLIDTLIWTGVLIALVLVIRRPVAKAFGPGMAYALWALPMGRLVMPPITLPAWLAPEKPVAVEAGPPANSVDFAPVAFEPAAMAEPAEEASAPLPELGAIDWEWLASATLALWLAGAAVFLVIRFRHYFALRDELIEEGREVGRIAGPIAPIRLLETEGTRAPLAFGVLDPVIALPPDFMAQPDRTARDLALEHELAHHRGLDLVINVAVQPLFALHWFNPLGRYGWLALRRDQEAACDARVMAARGQRERAAYARLIASFAAGPNVALAAPMACPVLGEQSIIHRLRSLKMSDLSPRRRLAGRLVLGAAVLALPLTASISYAEASAPEAPVAPEAPQTPGDAPQPPQPPAPPQPPEAPRAPAPEAIETVDPDTATPQVFYEEESEYVTISEDENGKRRKVIVKRVTDGDGKTVSKDERAIALGTRTEVIRAKRADGEMSEEEIEAIMVEVREGLAAADRALKDVPAIVAEAMAEAGSDTMVKQRTVIEMKCDPASDEVATTSTDADGVTVVRLCQSRVMEQALEGIREARRSIAENREMSASMRKKVLRELDRQIDSWEDAAS